LRASPIASPLAIRDRQAETQVRLQVRLHQQK
jgi:hypothetical protein